uniref:DUF6699 domain-containing protein n=2 Tax=Schizophyllum commune (strain H4-8 / FGSC 9210) TaxID=578458 RepID=D8PQU4_SCHCM
MIPRGRPSVWQASQQHGAWHSGPSWPAAGPSSSVRIIPPPPGAHYIDEHDDGEPATAEVTTPIPSPRRFSPRRHRRATSMPRHLNTPAPGPSNAYVDMPPWASPGAASDWSPAGAGAYGAGGAGGGGWGAPDEGGAPGGWEDWNATTGAGNNDPWATGPASPPNAPPGGFGGWNAPQAPGPDMDPMPDSYFAPRNAPPPSSPWHPSAGQTPGPTWGNLPGTGSPYPSWSSSQTPPSRGLTTPQTPASALDQPTLGRSFFGGLGRSASQTQPKPRHNKRSNSIDVHRSVSDALPHYRNGWKPTEGYGPLEPARRPREWRPEYTVRPSFASYIPRGRRDTVVDDFTDPVRRKLSYLLAYASPPPVFWDIRYDPEYVNCLNFPCLRRQHNEIDFFQIASEPPVERMRLVHHRLPWYIEILQSQPNGITVGDIITQMYAQLSMSILAKDYWNEEMTEADREKITVAYRKRCKDDEQELGKGVKRVDYLGERVIFEGLHKKGGIWEIKLKKKHE